MNTHKLLIILLLASSCLILGCVPLVAYDYYSPKAEGGIALKSECGGSVGPKDRIEFSIEGVKIDAKTNEMQGGIFVYFKMQIPKGKEVRIQDPTVSVSIPSNAHTFKGTLNPKIYSDETPWEIGDTLVGETEEYKALFGTKIYGKFFYMIAQINMPKSDEFILRLPALYINKELVELPDIFLTKDKYTTPFMPINC